MLKIIFNGSDAIGGPLLSSLHHHPNLEVSLVVTGQDKAMGRKMQLSPNPIKELALKLKLPIYQPEKISDFDSVERLKSEACDFLVVMAYGQIMNQAVLDIPTIEALNVHTSLLPKYRGASPIQSALLNGDQKTGISLMRMVQKMDAGPVYKQFELMIGEGDTAGSLWDKLADLAAKKVPDSLLDIASQALEPVDQNEAEATYITKISKADGEINWSESAGVIHQKIRAFNPWPSAYTFFKTKRLKIHKSIAGEFKSDEIPGMVVETSGGIGVVTGDGVLKLTEVQLEGKKRQSIQDFINGNQSFLGVILG